MADTEKALSWLTPGKPVEHEINGKKFNFYRLPAKVLMQCREMGKPLIRAFSTLLSTTQNNATERKRHFKSPEKIRLEKTGPNGEPLFEEIAVLDEGDEVERSAITPELAQHRIEQRNAALQEMVDVFTDPAHMALVGSLICNCLHEQFPRRPVPAVEVDAFLDQVDAPTLAAMLWGVVKANFSLFRGLEGKVQAAVDAALAKISTDRPSPTRTDAVGSSSPTTSPSP